MSKFEKSFAGGNPLKADELNQMAAAINDNDDQIASLREETNMKLTELEDTTNKNVVFDNALSNKCMKELWLSDSSITSNVKTLRFYYNRNNIIGFVLFDSVMNEILVGYHTKPSWESAESHMTPIITDNSTYYAAIDWNEVKTACGDNNYIDIPCTIIGNVSKKELSPNITNSIQAYKLNFFPITNIDAINECVKELYIPGVDVSKVTQFRLYYQWGGSSVCGVELMFSGGSYVAYKKYTTVPPSIITDNSSFYLVADWDKVRILCGETKYIELMCVVNKHIADVEFNPSIKSYISSRDAVNTITITPDDTPCKIANAIRAITDASPNNRYLVKVKAGEYQETDIVTKDYVDIIGEGDKTILIHDGNATYNSPSDYSLDPAYSNVPVNTIPLMKKHLILHCSNSVVKDVCLVAKGACKYISHQDGFTREIECAKFENVIFRNQEATEILGIGAFGGQNYLFENCTFMNEFVTWVGKGTSFNLHNWTNQSAPCSVKFKSCNFLNCLYIDVTDMGSNHGDAFVFDNCCTDYPEQTLIRYKGDSTSTSYSISLSVYSGNIYAIVDANRYDASTKVSTPFTKIGYNSSTTYNFGMAVRLPDLYKATNADTEWAFVTYVGNFLVASMAKKAYGLCNADTYSSGDAVYINNGIFQKNANGNIAGYVRQSTTLSKNGYLLIEKA